MRITPIDRDSALRFIWLHHGHSDPPKRHKFFVSLALADGAIVGVGVAGTPRARLISTVEPTCIEITRVCLIEDAPKNSASMIYGALCRAAKELGYLKAITYTLKTEQGVSTRAAGFLPVADVKADKVRRRVGQQLSMGGEGYTKRKAVKRVRWERPLGR